MIPTLSRVSLRYLAGHRLQVLLLVLGVALGVAVVVAIDLASESARRSFTQTADSIRGRATHQVIGGPSGLDESFYRRLRLELGVRAAAPVVETYVDVPALGGRTVRLVGVDPFAEGPFRDYVTDPGDRVDLPRLEAFMAEPETVLLSADLAGDLGLRPGGALAVETGGRRIAMRVAGLLRPADAASRKALASLLICDIATAQEVTRQPGRLSRVDLVLRASSADDLLLLERIRRALPPSARLLEAGSRAASIQQMSASFELNLSAVSVLALLVGLFLVHNTVTFFVVGRRPLFGTLRSLGVTRGQVFRMILAETALLGLAGTVVGLGLGALLGQAAVHLVTRTLNDLYFVVGDSEAVLSPLSLARGLVVGLVSTLLSAILPAREAASVPPISVLRRSDIETRASRLLGRLFVAGLVSACLGAGLLALPGRRLDLALAALLAFFLAAALLVPLWTSLFMRALAWAFRLLPGIVLSMAPRNVARSLSRTAVAVAGLMVAVSVIVGIQVMVGSFRETFTTWLDATLSADVFVTTASSSLSLDDAIDPAVAREIENLPGVDHVRAVRSVRLEDARYGRVYLVAVFGDGVASRRFKWMTGPVPAVIRAVREGAVLVSEPFAWRHHVEPVAGAEVELPTERGVRRFPVAGIYYDYGTDQGSIIMDGPLYRSLFADDRITSIAVHAAPGSTAEALAARIERHFEGRLALLVQPNRSLRERAMAVFERTFTITAALRVVVGVVAFIGVLGTLMSLQLERAREIGILRANGMTVGQVWRLVLLETGLMGLCAGLLALPLGTALAWALVYIINPRSFGWTMAFVPRPGAYVEALAVAVLAALLAGVYPALRFSRLRPAEALRQE